MLLHEHVQTKVPLHGKRYTISLAPDFGGQLLVYRVDNLLQYTVLLSYQDWRSSIKVLARMPFNALQNLVPQPTCMTYTPCQNKTWSKCISQRASFQKWIIFPVWKGTIQKYFRAPHLAPNLLGEIEGTFSRNNHVHCIHLTHCLKLDHCFHLMALHEDAHKTRDLGTNCLWDPYHWICLILYWTSGIQFPLNLLHEAQHSI